MGAAALILCMLSLITGLRRKQKKVECPWIICVDLRFSIIESLSMCQEGMVELIAVLQKRTHPQHCVQRKFVFPQPAQLYRSGLE